MTHGRDRFRHAVLAAAVGCLVALAGACGGQPPSTGGPAPSAATSGGSSAGSSPGTSGNKPPIATVIPGSAPLGGRDSPPATPPSGGPVPSYGLASPFVADGQAPLMPRPTPRPDGGEIRTFLISPADFFDEVIREGSTLTVFTDGSIRVDSVRGQVGDNHMDWALPEDQAPAIDQVLDVYARACGWGEGDFYEIYGPWDSVEFEYEVTPPASDGCWHFTEAVGKAFDFEIWLHGNASMTITRLELVVTLRK